MINLNQIKKYLKNISNVNEDHALREITDEDRKYYKVRDKTENEITSPPEDESINLATLWVVEAFTPPYFSNLENGIKKLGWDNNDQFINPDIVEKVKYWRSGLYYSGSLNLGIVYPKTENRVPGTRTANFPAGIKWINADIVQVLPSCTFLCCQFGLSEELQNSIEIPLRKKYSTWFEQKQKGYRIHRVEHQKRDQVELAREYVRTLCSNWILENMSGFFAANGTKLPTSELILFDDHSPFDKIGEKFYQSYMDILGFRSLTDAYKINSSENIFLNNQLAPQEAKKKTLIFGAKSIDAISDEHLKFYGDVSKKEGIIDWANDLDKTIVTWGLYEVVKQLQKNLGCIRDEYAKVKISSDLNNISLLKKIELEFMEIQTNSIPFINELTNYCNNNNRYFHNIFEFSPVEKIHDDQLNYFENNRQLLLMLSKQLQSGIDQVRSISDRISQLTFSATTILSNKTNLKLQKRIFWLTVLLVILTLLLVILTLRLVIPDVFMESILNYINNLFNN